MGKKEFRMLHWLLLAAFFYVSAVIVHQPQIETGLWKAGHITLGAYLGYWIDVHLLGHYTPDLAFYPRVLARAIIVGACVYGMSMGL